MSDDIELRLMRVVGHARRGWKTEAAEALGVTPRTIHRAVAGYTPKTFLVNLADIERKKGLDRSRQRRHPVTRDDTTIDAALEAEVDRLTDLLAYLDGLADGLPAAIRMMQGDIPGLLKPDPNDPERNTAHPAYAEGASRGFALGVEQVQKLLPQETGKRPQPPVREPVTPAPQPVTLTDDEEISVGERMMNEVADELRAKGFRVSDILVFHGMGNLHKEVSRRVAVSLDKVAHGMWKGGRAEAQKVAEQEKPRLMTDLEKLAPKPIEEGPEPPF